MKYLFKEDTFVTQEVMRRLVDETKGSINIGLGSFIEAGVSMNISNTLFVGREARINSGCIINGNTIFLGSSFYLARDCEIGAGSCFDDDTGLHVGDWFQGHDCLINIGRRVVIGDEVGFGRGTKIYTHGAHLSALEGFPVQFERVIINSKVWLPGAIVNPGVVIGRSTVVAVGSVVNKSLPSYSLCGGVPAKVIRRDCYLESPTLEEQIKMILDISEYVNVPTKDIGHNDCGELVITLLDTDTKFNVTGKTISGKVDEGTERFRNQLRRNGVRFAVWNPDNVARLFNRVDHSTYHGWDDLGELEFNG